MPRSRRWQKLAVSCSGPERRAFASMHKGLARHALLACYNDKCVFGRIVNRMKLSSDECMSFGSANSYLLRKRFNRSADARVFAFDKYINTSAGAAECPGMVATTGEVIGLRQTRLTGRSRQLTRAFMASVTLRFSPSAVRRRLDLSTLGGNCRSSTMSPISTRLRSRFRQHSVLWLQATNRSKGGYVVRCVMS